MKYKVKSEFFSISLNKRIEAGSEYEPQSSAVSQDLIKRGLLDPSPIQAKETKEPKSEKEKPAAKEVKKQEK